MTSDVREVGNAILDAAEREALLLSNLSLNKIIYFAHAWYLAQYSEPLVSSPFEAWQFGPVHPQIYRQMKKYKDGPITGRLVRIDLETGEDVIFEVNLDKKKSDHIVNITRFYGVRSASWLVDMSHEAGAPWDMVWTKAEKRSIPGMVIPDALTESFFRNKIKGRS